MSIFDRFKTRRTRESQDQKQQLLTKVQQAALREKTKAVTAKVAQTKVAVAAEHNNTKAQNTGVKRGQAWQVLKGPHITERATELAERHLYVFKVAGFAKSAQVAHAVSEVYGVNVKKARVINMPSKPKRLGRHVGRQPGYKKAIVELVAGEHIEILPR